MVDEFFILDNVQYTKRDFRNRNKIKTAIGTKWITIPVRVKGRYLQKINEVTIADENWMDSHWGSIKQSYSKAKYFKKYEKIFQNLYEDINSNNLSEVNLMFIKTINKILNINTKILQPENTDNIFKNKTLRLLDICKNASAKIYLSGKNAQEYLDIQTFKNNNVNIEWMSYEGYKPYKQLFPPFNHFVSILDLIFNEGPFSKKYMISFKNNPTQNES